MSTRKTRQPKTETGQGSNLQQTKGRNTRARVTSASKGESLKKTSKSGGSQKPTKKRPTTASKAANVKGTRKITNKKLKGTESKEYKQSTRSVTSRWEEPKEQLHTHSPGRIHNEDNIGGLGVRKTEQNARNISQEQIYEQGASVYGDGNLYRTQQSTTQYPPYDREGYTGQQQGFREYNNYDDHYWWEGQFPQASSSWEGEGRWQHHDKPWSHRQNQQGHRSNLPYGGDYEKHAWLQRQRSGRNAHSEDYERGFSRGNMTWGEAAYPDDQRRREDIYQDPGLNFDQQGTGYFQAYGGRGDDIGHVPNRDSWNESQRGSHFHRDDIDWDNFDVKRRDIRDYEMHGRRDEKRHSEQQVQAGGTWGPRDEYRKQSYDRVNYGNEKQQDEMYHSRSTNMRDRIMDYMNASENEGRMHTVWTNSLDEPYLGGYNTRTPQSDHRVVGQGGYNQGGYGKMGYSEQYGNAGGYGSTGAYQSGHRGEHRRGDYDEGFIYDERQDKFMEQDLAPPTYDSSYIVGSDDESFEDIDHSYKARLQQEYGDDTGQFEGNVHGMRHYGEEEGSKWKGRNDGNHSGGRSMGHK